MPFRAYTKGWCYWKTYPNLQRQIGLKWENLFENMGFNAFSGLHEGLVLLKDLPKPSIPNRTYMRKSFWKVCLQFTGPKPHGFTWGLVLLKDLPKTANTVRYFHAQIKIMMDKSYLQRSKMMK